MKGTGASQQWTGLRRSPPTPSCSTAGMAQHCSTACGAAPAVSTGLKLAESKEPGWSRGWALGWELGLCLRGQSLSPCPQSRSQPSSAAASQTRVERGQGWVRLLEQRTSCGSKTNTSRTVNFYNLGDLFSGALGWREWVGRKGRAQLLKYSLLMAPSESSVRADGINTPRAQPTRGDSCQRGLAQSTQNSQQTKLFS